MSNVISLNNFSHFRAVTWKTLVAINTKLNTWVIIQANKLQSATSCIARLQHHMVICATASITVTATTIALWLKQSETYIKQGPYLSSRNAANSASLLSPYKSHSSLHLWKDALIFILVFSLARSNSLFLYCLSSSVFLFLLFDVGNGGAFFSSVVICSLFMVWVWIYLTR